MAAPTYFTIHETAVLSGATKNFIEKSMESRVVTPVTRPDDVRGEQVRHLPFSAILFFATLRVTRLHALPLKHKRVLWMRMRDVEDENGAPIEVMPGVVFGLLRRRPVGERRPVRGSHGRLSGGSGRRVQGGRSLRQDPSAARTAVRTVLAGLDRGLKRLVRLFIDECLSPPTRRSPPITPAAAR